MKPPKIMANCDNRCVGILVWKNKKLLLIERKKYNFGFASPAGHLDGDKPKAAAIKELWEETGLAAKKMKKVLVKRLDNPCRRPNGSYHQWHIFKIIDWAGKIKASPDETKSYLWADQKTLKKLANRLEKFLVAHRLDLKNLPRIVEATNEDKSWQKNPGLEPPWYIFYKLLGLI